MCLDSSLFKHVQNSSTGVVMLKSFFFSFLVLYSLQVFASPATGKFFDRAIFVVFENTNYASAIKQPFFKQLAEAGANFSNMKAVTHPSQGNYIALTSGSINGVKGDGNINLDVKNIVDILEAQNITWKVYAEDYPGNCFTGSSSKQYARKHNPFISYNNIRENPIRCAKIVNSEEFDKDVLNGTLPEYVFYIPNEKNDGHDTGVAFADKWYKNKFEPLLQKPQFMENTVLISMFDEDEFTKKNQIYTSIVGPSVSAIDIKDGLNIYSILNLIEENWSLVNLGKEDDIAPKIPNIWQ